ncbi:MAG: hypothetical protein WA118_00255 [Carboxydocellales bacterium]
MPNNNHDKKITDNANSQGKDTYNGSDLPTMEMEYVQRHARRPEAQQAKQSIKVETTGVSDEEKAVDGTDKTTG